jgi:hypothetical protein
MGSVLKLNATVTEIRVDENKLEDWLTQDYLTYQLRINFIVLRYASSGM